MELFCVTVKELKTGEYIFGAMVRNKAIEAKVYTGGTCMYENRNVSCVTIFTPNFNQIFPVFTVNG